MIRLPDFDHDDLILIDGRVCRILYDAEGNEVHRIYAPRDHWDTGITISRTKDPTAYHREYYRKVRSKRQGCAPRGPYKKNT